ncbi:MAG: hypothetical protein AAGA92_05435 [Planctomycetota bacterium]
MVSRLGGKHQPPRGNACHYDPKQELAIELERYRAEDRCWGPLPWW